MLVRAAPRTARRHPRRVNRSTTTRDLDVGAVEAAADLARDRRTAVAAIMPGPPARAAPRGRRPGRRTRRPIGELLPRLVTLARDHDGVARRGLGDRHRDRGASIRLDHVRPAALDRPGLDLGDDLERVFRARVVGRDDRAVGDRRGGLPHQGSLGAVAVSPATEHDDQPARGQRARGLQHAEDAIRRVRVVHHHQEVLSLPRSARRGPGTSRTSAMPATIASSGTPTERHNAIAARQLDTLNAPRNDDRDLEATRLEREPRGRHPQTGGPQGGIGLDAERGHRDLGRLEQAPAPCVVGVHDAPPSPARCEQARLRREVRLHRRVVVEVVLRQVRERHGVEHDPVHPVLLEGVRGDLHGHEVDTPVTHARQQPVEVGRLGGRALDRRPDRRRSAPRWCRSRPGDDRPCGRSPRAGRSWSSCRSCPSRPASSSPMRGHGTHARRGVPSPRAPRAPAPGCAGRSSHRCTTSAAAPASRAASAKSCPSARSPRHAAEQGTGRDRAGVVRHVEDRHREVAARLGPGQVG